MDYELDICLKNRTILNTFLDNFTLEILNKVPEGFKNSIFWNIAHIVVTQQLLVYNLSGLPMLISKEMVEIYKKGEKTKNDITQDEVNEVRALLMSTVKKTKEDYENNLFKNYKSYTTSTLSVISCVEEAIAFNNYHEGIHLGYILALKKSFQ